MTDTPSTEPTSFDDQNPPGITRDDAMGPDTEQTPGTVETRSAPTPSHLITENTPPEAELFDERAEPAQVDPERPFSQAISGAEQERLVAEGLAHYNGGEFVIDAPQTVIPQ